LVTAKCPECGDLVQILPKYVIQHPTCKKCRLKVEQALESASPKLQQAIDRKYQEHVDACLRADLAPASFDVIARECLDCPALADIDPPARHESRSHSSLRQFENVKIY
jgi:hypothetical protein